MSLDKALSEGAKIYHPETAHELLSHLRHVHRCNDSTDPSRFVAINKEFDGNHVDNGDRWPILRLIGLCYTTPTGQVIMFLVDLKEVDEMKESENIESKLNCVSCLLQDGSA